MPDQDVVGELGAERRAQLLDLGLVCEGIGRAADYGDLYEAGEGSVVVADADRGVGGRTHPNYCKGDREVWGGWFLPAQE